VVDFCQPRPQKILPVADSDQFLGDVSEHLYEARGAKVGVLGEVALLGDVYFLGPIELHERREHDVGCVDLELLHLVVVFIVQ